MKMLLAQILGLVMVSGTARAETLDFCYDPYPPYTLGESGTPHGGLKVAFLEAVVARIDGLNATVTLMPWKRCQLEARDGNMDGILPLFANDDRREYLAFTSGTIDQQSAFLHLNEQFEDGYAWDGDFEGLAHLRLGMLTGSYIDAEMESAFEAQRGITRARDGETLIELLVLGRVDLVAIDAIVAAHILASKGWTNRVSRIDTPISTKMSYFGLSKASGADRYLDEFNRVIAELHDDGTVAAILGGDY